MSNSFDELPDSVSPTQAEYENFLKLKEGNKVKEMLIKLYKEVIQFNTNHPTLRLYIPADIYCWYEEERIKGGIK